jgi:arylsulfatase A-like enzyme
MRFTDAYAACPVCSPTRSSILTEVSQDVVIRNDVETQFKLNKGDQVERQMVGAKGGKLLAQFITRQSIRYRSYETGAPCPVSSMIFPGRAREGGC